MGHRQGCILRRPKNESRKRTHHDRGQFIIASSDILRRAICLAAASSYSHHPAQIGRSGRWDPHAGVKLAQTGATWPVSPQLTHAVQTCHRKGMMNPMMMPDKARRPATQGEDIKPSHRDARVLSPENQPLLEELVNKYGKEGWERVYDMAAVALCARNVPYLSGRVLLQVSLRHLNDREAIIKQCRSFAEGFKGAGVPRDRFAIKLPFSGSAASAAAQLNAEGIRTLATTVFSLEQAIAASQSNCLFISPYYNEIAAHLDPSLRPNVSDPALEHPMSARVIHILDTFAKAYAETGEEQPIMIIASHFNTAEILAMAELGCQHITIQAHNLKALLETPDTLPPVTKKKPDHPYAEFTIPERLKTLANLDPLSGEDWDGVLATTRTDYVVNGGAQLDQFIQGNAVVKKRLQDAEKLFLDAEEKAGAAIRQLMAAKGL